jgi:spermidine synthase
VEVDAVDLLPEVIAATRHFIEEAQPRNPGLRMLVADARRFVQVSRTPYDVIVSDNFHPARSGSATLYTVEHFAAVRERLAPDGVFCQWLPLHQLDLGSLRSIVRSFIRVYPQSLALLATNSLDTPVLGLMARRDGGGVDLRALTARISAGDTPSALGALGLTDDLAVLGNFIAGPAALARFAGDAPLNTDDRPVVAYLAPRITYAPDLAPRDRLLELLAEVDIAPEELLAHATDAEWKHRLAAYLRARDRYLEIGRSVRVASSAEDMLAQVREPLLQVLDISADFRPAYDPLLHMATELAQRDAGAARSLLARLARLQPGREEAAEALRALDGAAL